MTNIICIIFLIICSYTDIKRRTVYNSVLIIFAISGAMIELITNSFDFSIFLPRLWGLGLVAIIGFLLYLTNTLGAGDVKLMAVISILSSIKITAYTGALGILIGGIISVFVLIYRKQKSDEIDHQIPFAPMLAAGYILALLICK